MREEVPAGWAAVALVCGKCSRRIGGGFGAKGRMPLAKALRRLLPKTKRRRKAAFGVVEVACLGLCPKDAVVAIAGARPGDWLLVRPGTPVAQVAARLGLPRQAD